MSEPGTPRPEDDWNASNPQDPSPYGQPPTDGQPADGSGSGHQQPPYGQPSYGSQPPYGQSADGGQNSPYGQSADDGQQPPYGQSPPGGQPPYGQPPYGQSSYGQQPPYGQPYGQQQPPYGQTPYNQGAYGRPHGNPYGLRPNIPTYLAGSILVTLFCCLPTGVASIVYAAQVNSRLAAGDIVGAQQSSDKARTWMIASIVLGVVGVILWFFLIALGSTSP